MEQVVPVAAVKMGILKDTSHYKTGFSDDVIEQE